MVMILMCGGTGDLGGRILRLLIEDGQDVRALVRPQTDASGLPKGIEVARGDLRDRSSLDAALVDVDTVVTTANAVSRSMTGEKGLTIAAVDGEGNQNLIRAADQARVRRFVLMSAAGMGRDMARLAPLMAAKQEAEKALWRTSMRVVVVRPDMFQEAWLGPEAGFDLANRKATVRGRGTQPHRFVAMDDVARLTANLAVRSDPPGVMEFGGPEALSVMDVVAAYEAAAGTELKVSHVPRTVLRVLDAVFKRTNPSMATGVGLSLFFDTHAGTWDDRPLREVGVEPRPATAFIEAVVRASL